MNQLSEILDEKGTDVLQIEADASVFEAVQRMVEANVGSLLVTEDGEITGIVTERDYLRRVALEGRTDKETAVGEIMSSPLIVVTPQTTIDECMALMTDRRIRHLPVVDGGEVAGIVSIGDIVKFKSKQQSFEIQYLTTTSPRAKTRTNSSFFCDIDEQPGRWRRCRRGAAQRAHVAPPPKSDARRQIAAFPQGEAAGERWRQGRGRGPGRARASSRSSRRDPLV
ncbi:MAG: CBS domain-containing protein [Actinomycetota bacterium]|nr:CBS domain-containing protein [Actinomycetota bacterium]